MFKKTMKFDNLDGEEVSQTFYFNYNKKEVAELLEFGYILDFPPEPGEARLPLEKQLEILQTPVEESGLSDVENSKTAYKIFQALILDAYGEKSEDNVRFMKNQRTRDYLKSHVAFVEIIFEFLENPKLAAQFIENCLPEKFVAEAKAELQSKSEGKLSSDDLASMVEEAERRQKDPATRIEPGPEAAAEALGENKEIAALAEASADAESGPIVTDGKTDEELLSMNPQDMSKAQMLRAFELKSKG